MVAVYSRVLHGDNSLAPQPDLCAGLGALVDLAHDISVERIYKGLAAEYSRREGNLHSGVHIHSLPLKAWLCPYLHLQEKISRLTAAGSRHTLALQADTLAAVNAGRNVDLQSLGTARPGRVLEGNDLIASKGCLVKGHLCLRPQVRALLPEGAASEASTSKAAGPSVVGLVKAVASCLYTQIPESRINTELFNHHQKTEYPYNHTENAF